MVLEKQIAKYGTWESVITPKLVSSNNIRLKEVHVKSPGIVYLVEGRPAERGRCAIVQIASDADWEKNDILPIQYSARSRVHEYGGGAIQVKLDGTVVFTDSLTSGVYLLHRSGDVEEIMPGTQSLRYGDFHVHPLDQRWLLAVQERHPPQYQAVSNTIVAIDTQSRTSATIASGADFYFHPRFSLDGKLLCWGQWNHPDMPWTGTELYIAEWEAGKAVKTLLVAGRARYESISQPRWHFDGSLFFCSDRTGFWQLYRWDRTSGNTSSVILEGFEDAEIGTKENVLGSHTYAPLNRELLVIGYTRKALSGILIYDIQAESITVLSTGKSDADHIQPSCIRRVSDTSFVVIGPTMISVSALYLVTIGNPTQPRLLKTSYEGILDENFISKSEFVSFSRGRGESQSGLAHAIFTPPNNPAYEGPPKTKPPLIVSIHGGPTSHVGSGLQLETQYYTSRGYAFVHVNHVGSTGYGRAYREALNYSWGIYDVDDTISCVEYLVSTGYVNGNKIGIRGASAGGYTTLQAMVNHPNVFAAGCSLYGIEDLKGLVQTTHKFESHYLYNLLFAENSTSEIKEQVYRQRSPKFNFEKIGKPLLLLHGADDCIVPVEQALGMASRMNNIGKDVTIIVFEGEGHGFDKMKSKERAIQEEESLWRRTLAI